MIRTRKKKTVELNQFVANENGIWIPAPLWDDPQLSAHQKAFLVEIRRQIVQNPKQICIKSNEYFSTFFNLSKKRCSAIINELVTKAYLLSEIRPSKKKAKQKRILSAPIMQKEEVPQ
jgi:hypothetical protein